MPGLLGGIEAGGTKFLCVVGTGPGDLRREERIPTTTPEETLAGVLDFFSRQPSDEPLTAIGMASFGPIDRDPRSPGFGRITSTPKTGWTDTDLVGPIRELGLPVGFDTDVNGAALAEHRWGAARGVDTFVYLTVGTGIGGGAMVAGRLVHGMLHPEMGHLMIPRRSDDEFEGVCPFHGACFEGLAAGPALERRWGRRAEELPEEHPAWELEAHYLALGLGNVICALSPRRVILGGGVMKRGALYPAVRRALRRVLNGYLAVPEILEANDEYIVPPALGQRAGGFGALALAEQVVEIDRLEVGES